jgi:LCP family protein required for cell wall assembly
MRKLTLLILFLFILLVGVIAFSPGLMRAMPLPDDGTPQVQVSTVAVLVTVPPDAAPTPTPFQPLAPTPTYLPEVAGESISPKPTQQPENGTIPALSSEGRVNFLLLGSDQRPYEGGFRTDTIILVSLDPANGTASLVSFPRDLYVTIPGWTQQRINTAMGYGGFPLLASTLEYNFGVRPAHYVMVNFWAFVETIDSLGGIDVYASQPLTDRRNGRYYTVPAGLNHMDGETALWYARSRYSTSDFDRGRRQQEVVLAIFKRLLSLNAIEKAPELYDIYARNVTTDLTFGEIAPLLPLAAKLSDTSRIHQYFIGPAQVIPWTTPGGAQVLLPNAAAINAVLWQAINGQ